MRNARPGRGCVYETCSIGRRYSYCVTVECDLHRGSVSKRLRVAHHLQDSLLKLLQDEHSGKHTIAKLLGTQDGRAARKPDDHSPPRALRIERDSAGERFSIQFPYVIEILISQKSVVAALEQFRNCYKAITAKFLS